MGEVGPAMATVFLPGSRAPVPARDASRTPTPVSMATSSPLAPASPPPDALAAAPAEPPHAYAGNALSSSALARRLHRVP